MALPFSNIDPLQFHRDSQDRPETSFMVSAALLNELLPREALLHLSVRLGLLHLSRFLIGQPMGQRALTMPNEEGETPLQLAQRRGDHSLFMALATSPVPQRSPLVGVWCVWADSTRVLRFCPGSGCLSLTFLGGPESSVLGNILVLREKLMDHNILRQISALRGDVQMEDSYGLDVHRSDASDGGLGRGLPLRYLTLVDSVFEDQLVLSLDDDEELPTLQTGTIHSSAVGWTDSGPL
nr:rho guanine nucleotide exchange factor 28-like [Salvelinus alpinus]